MMIIAKYGIAVFCALFLLFLIFRIKRLFAAKEEADANRFMDISMRKSSVRRFRERREQLIQQIQTLCNQLSQYRQQKKDNETKQADILQRIKEKDNELAMLERKLEKVQQRISAKKNHESEENTSPAAFRLQQSEISLMTSRMAVSDELTDLHLQNNEKSETIVSIDLRIKTTIHTIEEACGELGKPEQMIRRILRNDQRAIGNLGKMDQKTHRILRDEGIIDSAEALIRRQIY